MKLILEDTITVESREDGGAALIARFDDKDTGMFVRVQSWDETGEHAEFKKFEGKRVRVTVEVID